MRDEYLFYSLRSLLMLKPNHHYTEFPQWKEHEKKQIEKEQKKQDKTGDELLDDFLSKRKRA